MLASLENNYLKVLLDIKISSSLLLLLATSFTQIKSGKNILGVIQLLSQFFIVLDKVNVLVREVCSDQNYQDLIFIYMLEEVAVYHVGETVLIVSVLVIFGSKGGSH